MTDVVILPGLDGTGTLLVPFRSALAHHGMASRVIDYPTDVPLDYDALETRVRARLPTVAPFVLLGESFSGPVAIRIAANPPPGLVGLILSTTFCSSPVPMLAPLSPLLRFALPRPPVRWLTGLLLGPWSTPDLTAMLTRAVGAVQPAVLRRRALAALRVDVTVSAAAVNIPTLQWVARNDRLVSRSVSDTLTRALPTNRHIEIAGPHLLLHAAASRCAEEVAAFALGLRR